MEDKIAFIEKWDAFSAGKIRALLEKKTAMVEEANLYGEKYTPRQFQISLDQILKREMMRSRICEAVSEEVKPVRRIAEDVELSPRSVLRHIVELRRRGLVVVDHIEDGKTPYYRYTAPGGSS
jgi:DNA-binding transcriptional ArsR family regulator